MSEISKAAVVAVVKGPPTIPSDEQALQEQMRSHDAGEGDIGDESRVGEEEGLASRPSARPWK